MSKHLKVLGLSLLALAGVMAASASAAQAKWLLLLNKTSVNQPVLHVNALEGEMVVPELGLVIHCLGGLGSVSLVTLKEGAELSASGSLTFTNCVVLGVFSETCTIHSKGEPNGSITASASGLASMPKGEEEIVNVTFESAEFTTLELLGEECPLTEIDASISGAIGLTLLEALKDTALHLAHLDDVALFWGEEPAALEGLGEKLELTDELLLHLYDLGNETATWAIHLVNL